MEEFVTYEQAVKLKELGFDWKCDYWYYNVTKCQVSVHGSDCFDFDNMTKSPTLAQVQKWLREVKKILILIDIRGINEKVFHWKIFNSDIFWTYSSDVNFDTYEEALSVGIDKTLEILKEKK